MRSREIHIRNEEMFRFAETVGPTKKYKKEPRGTETCCCSSQENVKCRYDAEHCLTTFDNDEGPEPLLRPVWEDLLR